MASDIKYSITKFEPLIPNNPQSPVVCVVRVFDAVSGLTVGEQTLQWDGSVLASQTDEQVLEFVMKHVVEFSQSVVASADATVDKFVEFSRRYSNLVGTVHDVPDLKDTDTKVAEAVQEKRKDESEWKLEVSVRDAIDLTPADAVLEVEEQVKGGKQ